MKSLKQIFLAVIVATLPHLAGARVTMPAFFASGMVFQQNSKVSIPCKASPNSDVTVTVSWQNKKINLKSDDKGNFSFTFNVPKASKKSFWIRFSDNGETTLINDLYAGEVWLCGGQSNMEMPIQGWGCINNYEEEVKNADYPNIRLLKVAYRLGFSPQDNVDIDMSWKKCAPETAADFSALAYFFGRELYQKLDIPIGLVYCAWGGTPCQSWMSFEALRKVGGFDKMLDLYEECHFNSDEILKRDANAKHFQNPTLQYNAMIHPLHVMPIAGAIWYQGEANAGGYKTYDSLFKGLINDWRGLWKKDFPFYFVQLAGYQKHVEVQPNSNWAGLRWAQQKALELDNTGMATAIDVGEENDIHPKNKQEVGRRLGLLALKNTYGFDEIIDKAPVLKSYSFTKRKAVLNFSGKLNIKGTAAVPTGIILETPDRRFVKARCNMPDDSTVVATGVFSGIPLSVRYNWGDFPKGNLYGENNLPVLPFRTDDMKDIVNGMAKIHMDKHTEKVNVYNAEGILVRKNAERRIATSGLSKGVYIIGTHKVLVR